MYNSNGERHIIWEHWGPVGTNCLIDNVEALQESFSLCQRYGLDCISTGGVLAFAMECYEKGLLSEKETGGIDLTWGNHQAMVEMVKRIGKREGLDWLLGEGVRRAVEQIGGTASEYAIQRINCDPNYHRHFSKETLMVCDRICHTLMLQ
jgi:aldehyde:ferredoxin oxidoreductase